MLDNWNILAFNKKSHFLKLISVINLSAGVFSVFAVVQENYKYFNEIIIL